MIPLHCLGIILKRQESADLNNFLRNQNYRLCLILGLAEKSLYIYIYIYIFIYAYEHILSPNYIIIFICSIQYK